MKALFKRAGWTFLVPLLSLGFQLVVDVLVARSLGPQLLGEMAFAFSLAGLLSIFLLFGVGEIAIQQYTARERPPAEIFTSTAVILLMGSAVCVTLAVVVCSVFELSSLTRVAAGLSVMTLILNGASSVCNHVIIAYEVSQRDVWTVLGSRVVLVLGVLAMLPTGSLALVLGVFVVAALAQLAMRLRLVHREVFELRWCWREETTLAMWRRGRHIGFGSIFGTAANRADTLLLRHMAGAHATGLYGAAYRFVTGLQAISSALSLALYPMLKRRETAPLVRTVYVLSALAPALALVLMSVTSAELLVWMVYGDAFEAAARVLRWLLLASALQWLHVFASRWWIACGRESVLPRAQAAGALLGLAALALLIPEHGALGAAWATLVGDAVSLGVLSWLAHRMFHEDPTDP